MGNLIQIIKVDNAGRVQRNIIDTVTQKPAAQDVVQEINRQTTRVRSEKAQRGAARIAEAAEQAVSREPVGAGSSR